jgi:hypothetical protein
LIGEGDILFRFLIRLKNMKKAIAISFIAAATTQTQGVKLNKPQAKGTNLAQMKSERVNQMENLMQAEIQDIQQTDLSQISAESRMEKAAAIHKILSQVLSSGHSDPAEAEESVEDQVGTQKSDEQTENVPTTSTHNSLDPETAVEDPDEEAVKEQAELEEGAQEVEIEDHQDVDGPINDHIIEEAPEQEEKFIAPPKDVVDIPVEEAKNIPYDMTVPENNASEIPQLPIMDDETPD